MLLDNTGTQRSHKPNRSHFRLHREDSNRSYNPPPPTKTLIRTKSTPIQAWIKPYKSNKPGQRDKYIFHHLNKNPLLAPRLNSPSPLPLPPLLSEDISRKISNMVSTPPSTVPLVEEVNHPPTDPVSPSNNPVPSSNYSVPSSSDQAPPVSNTTTYLLPKLQSNEIHIPDPNVNTYTFRDDGRVTYIIDRNGEPLCSIRRDAFGRIILRTPPSPAFFNYDLYVCVCLIQFEINNYIYHV